MYSLNSFEKDNQILNYFRFFFQQLQGAAPREVSYTTTEGKKLRQGDRK